MDRRVSKSVGKVVKVAQVNPRHEDINMIRPLMLGKIITVQRSTGGVGQREEVSRIRDGKKQPFLRVHSGRGGVALARTVIKDEFLGVFFFLFNKRVDSSRRREGTTDLRCSSLEELAGSTQALRSINILLQDELLRIFFLLIGHVQGSRVHGDGHHQAADGAGVG
jgi:hypothetical protein